MSFRIFKRSSWRREAPKYPGDRGRIVPAPKPMDACRTIATVSTYADAVAYCTARNAERPQSGDSARLAPFYEFTEI